MRLRGYAGGGVVHPYDNALTPADLGLTMQPMPRLRLPSPESGANGAASPAAVVPKVVVVFDREGVMDELAKTTRFERATVHVVGNNPLAIQGKWRS
jgi:hypothetical protein